MKFRAAWFALLLSLPGIARSSGGPPPTPPPAASTAVVPAAPAEVASASLVRVNSTNQSFDFFRPWMKRPPFPRRGLGVVLSGNRVLVTAELIANHTYVELEKADSAEKCSAEVILVDYASNLALLRPADEKFLDGAPPLELDSGAKVGDGAAILQLESNGAIARTPATITTITVAPYPLENLSLLVFRLSSPLQNRDGSFTIPAVRNGRLLGLLMRYDSRNQTADIIPTPVIAHFLKDAGRSPYPGFPRAGVGFAPTRDPQLRRYVGLAENGGVYLTEVKAGGPAAKAGVRKGDILLAVNGNAIDQDGNFSSAEFGKIPFSHLMSTAAYAGDTVEFTILRDGAKQTLPVILESADPSKVVSPPHLFDRQPRYVILGGLVFQELSRAYLTEWGRNWSKEAPQDLVYLDVYQDELEDGHGKVVFLSQVLPGPDTIGYQNLSHLVVKAVNGVPVRNLDDLARAASSPADGFHKIEFDDDPGAIYLDAASVSKNEPALRRDYRLPSLQNLDAETPP